MAGRPPKRVWEEFAKDTHVLDTNQLSEKYSRSISTIRDWRNYLRDKGYDVGYGHSETYYVPVLNEWETLEGDAVITGDYHFPFVNWNYVERLFGVSKKLDVRCLIICGDLMDVQGLSYFKRTELPTRWADELRATERFIDIACDHFDRIIDTVGNHLRNRVLARLEGQLDTERLKRLFTTEDRVVLSPYPYLKLETERGTYHITHQKNYRKNPLSVPLDLCHKYKSHVITHHQHRMAFGFDESGKYFLISNGCMSDRRRMPWQAFQDVTSAYENNGFVVIKNGYPRLFGPHTDWSPYETIQIPL